MKSRMGFLLPVFFGAEPIGAETTGKSATV